MAHILAVDDDNTILDSLHKALTSEGHDVAAVNNPLDAFAVVDRQRIDLMILDVNMPELDGYELCQRVRKRYKVPIIFLSARDQVRDKITGLKAGGDDYLTKPYNARELILRVQSILRRTEQGHQGGATPTANSLRLDPMRQVALRGNEEIGLTHLEWRLINCLISHTGETVSYDRLVSEVWDDNLPAGSREVMVTIRRLRAKLDDDPNFPKYILTERGVGYRWIGE